MNIISLGAGVQSSTMALMAAHGEITPMPDCAIFADTGWEPKPVYAWLDLLESLLPFPIYRVKRGDIRDEIVSGWSTRAGEFASIPWFVQYPDGSRGMGRRECTAHYKIEPIHKKAVELNGGKRNKGGITMWIGISLDEASRMKESRVKYIVRRWPLIEQRMTRHDCLRWMDRAGYAPPPKSSCIGCPFHSDAIWRDMKNNNREAWDEAVRFDQIIRESMEVRGKTGKQFMHPSLKPLDKVDFSTAEDHGQINMFENECEGMCGI